MHTSRSPSARASLGQRCVKQILVLSGYFLLALASTWPLPLSAQARLPLGAERARTVPLFNLWTIGWNVESLASGRSYYSDAYWNAPIFFPERNALAMSEPQPATMLLWPVVWLSGSLLFTYNFYLWCSLTLNGWFTWLLCRQQNLRWPVSLGAGAAMLLLPFVHWQIGVVQLVPVWGVLWVWLALLRWNDDAEPSGTSDQLPRQQISPQPKSESRHRALKLVGRGIHLGLAVSVTFAMSAHHGIFALLLTALGGCTQLHKIWHWQTLPTMLVGAAIAGTLVGPLAWRLHQVAQEHEFVRDMDRVDQLSAQWSDYAVVYGHSWLGAAPERPREWWLSPGWITLILAMLGAVAGCWSRNVRRWTLFLLAMGIAAGVLSMGTHVQVGILRPWEWLVSYVPGFAQVRSAYRFALFFQMVAVCLAAIAIDRLWTSTSHFRKRSRGFGSRLLQVAIVLVGLVAVFDPWPPAMRLCVAPEPSADRGDWIEKLERAAPGGVLVLPISAGDSVRDYQRTAEWMLLGLRHGHPLVNGYSGFFPESYYRIANRMAAEGLSAELHADLYRLGVRYLVVYPYVQDDAVPTAELLQPMTDPTQLVQLYRMQEPSAE